MSGPLNSLLALLASTSATVVLGLAYNLARKMFLPRAEILARPEPTFSDRAEELLRGITESSKKVDELLADMESVSRERAERVSALTVEADRLTAKEKELQESVEKLSKEDIATLLQQQGQASRRSNLYYFFAGVAMQTVLTLLFHFVFRIG